MTKFIQSFRLSFKWLVSQLYVGLIGSVCFMFFSSNTLAVTAALSGNWNTPGTWVGGILPLIGDSISIPTGITVTITTNTPIVGDVVISGSLIISNSATSNLSYSGDLWVYGNLTNNGGIDKSIAGKMFYLNPGATYLHNPINSSALDETIFSNSVEDFQAGSNLIIQKWFDLSVPLGDPTRVDTSFFGNVTLQIPDTDVWQQDGRFMTDLGVGRILGTLTVGSGIVCMDNGNGNGGIGTNDLYLHDVMINGTGNIIFQSGPDRTLALITDNFTDISTSGRPTVISDSCFGTIFFNVNGNANINHNFYGIKGSGTEIGGNLQMTVTGNLSIGGGIVSFIRQADAPLSLSVNGNTTISGAPTSVRFIEGNSGDFSFSTNNLIISGGASNIFLGGSTGVRQYTGVPSVTINNDFTISGTSNTTFMLSDSTTEKLSLIVGHDFLMSGVNSVFTGAYSQGAFTFISLNNLSITNGQFSGQADPNCTALDSIIINSNFSFNSTNAADFFIANYGNGNTVVRCLGNFTLTNSGTASAKGFCGIYGGRGNLNFYTGGNYLQSNGRFNGIFNDQAGMPTSNFTMLTTGTFTMNGGIFNGIRNRYKENQGTISFTSGELTFTKGVFIGHYSSNNNLATGSFVINGNCRIGFTAVVDSFMFIGWNTIGAVANELALNLTVNGNFVLGNAGGVNGVFISSVANASETIVINGNDSIKAGLNSFNSYPYSLLTNAHKVFITISGNMVVSGGVTYLSANNDSLVTIVNGNFTMTGGELAVQNGNTAGIFKVKGGYTQQGGSFYLHRNATNFSYQPVTVDINYDDDATGDFIQSGGTINFEDNSNSTINTMFVRSPAITLTAGDITMALPGSNTVAGIFDVSHIGAVTFNRTSHNIQQVVFNVSTGASVTVNSGNLQIASSINPGTGWLLVESGAILDLKLGQIFSNMLQLNSGMRITGRLRIQHTSGLYNATATAAINGTGGMNFFLMPGNTVEYYGVDNQIVTGTGVGLALTTLHKYHNLEINFTGTPDVEYVYPTNLPNSRSVFIKNKLILTNGELNLDDDHVNTSGGRSIIIEKDSAVAVTRTNGYIRSEVVDGTSSVIWKIGSNPGPHIFPFATKSTPATYYIPFTFDLPSGNADTVTVATYGTPANNLPWPPTVTQLNNLSGSNNSANTVDRFWFLRSTGTAALSTLKFVTTPAEITGIVNPKAQRFIPAANAWEYPYQGTQSNIVNGTQVVSATGFNNNWWTLASQSSPLPITLVDFSSSCSGSDISVKWTTASEINNDFFMLSRSYDGEHFVAIAEIDGSGNSTSILSYTFLDKSAEDFPVVYYKLTQTDFDGTQTEFGPVSAKRCRTIDRMNVTVISSFGSQAELLLSSPSNDHFKISLFTVDGKLLSISEHAVLAGSNIISLNYPGINSSIYMIRLEGSSEVVTKKVVLGIIQR